MISVEQTIHNRQIFEFMMNEINILSRLDNVNIIKFIELLRTENNYYLVYEYANGGDLEEFRSNREINNEVVEMLLF